MDILANLNERQKEAVLYGDGPMLVLAGAGSGKTRVLTKRMANLICNRGVDPGSIFAVTFTNKAAAEMRERVADSLAEMYGAPFREDELWVTTFHSACVRILRSDIEALGFNRQFTIYDDSDQLSVVKAVLKELKISDQLLPPKLAQGRINKIKNEGRDHTTYRSSFGGPSEDAFIRMFQRYQEVLKLSSAVDFADLILLTVQLFEKHPKILAQYQKRFPYILIDEYQDTNRCQYLLMKALAGTGANVCAVGDEDQSIYRWRGADISNILNFEKDYPNAKIFKLEENYRSTRTIIEAASHVISHNTERREKSLWTQNTEGAPIDLFITYDEYDEANKITQQVQAYLEKGVSLNQLAIFYRTNAQSRLIEDQLRTNSVNYRIYGGLKFYDRLEVKDALAYLRLLVNPDDNVSFRRIVNVPARGIGAKSVERLTDLAVQQGTSCLRLLDRVFGEGENFDLGRSKKNFQKFYDIIQLLRKDNADLNPSDLLVSVLEQTGYRNSLKSENSVEAQSRLENLAELRQSLVEYELRAAGDDPNAPIGLEGFLEQAALVSAVDSFDAEAPALKMMTIHMAKGLEFDVVLIAGLEEELFPSIRGWESENPEDIEEERRLFYVGMTRARKELTLLSAKNRTVFGHKQFRVISRFIEELPEQYLQKHESDFFQRRRSYLDRPGLPGQRESQQNHDDYDFDQSSGFSDDVPDCDYDEDPFVPGRMIRHPVFGKGVIQQCIGSTKLVVNFPGKGTKKIARSFSGLEVL